MSPIPVPCPPRAGQFEHKHTLWWLTRPARKLTPAQSHAELFATRNLFREELGQVRDITQGALLFIKSFPFLTKLQCSTLVLSTSTIMHIQNLIVTDRKIYHWRSPSEIRNHARSIQSKMGEISVQCFKIIRTVEKWRLSPWCNTSWRWSPTSVCTQAGVVRLQRVF